MFKCKYNEARKKTETETHTQRDGGGEYTANTEISVIRPRHSIETSFILIGLFIAEYLVRFLWLSGLMRVQWFVLLSGPPQDYKAK